MRLQLLLVWIGRRKKKLQAQAKSTDTRPLANAFCFTVSSAPATPSHVSSGNARQSSRGGLGCPQWETERGITVVWPCLWERRDELQRSEGLRSTLQRERTTNTAENRVLYRSSHFPRGQQCHGGKVTTFRHIQVSQAPTHRKRSASVKCQHLKKHTGTNANLFFSEPVLNARKL